MNKTVVGIDLGTTNSEVAALHEGKVRVLGNGPSLMLPSCVGLSATGELLIGRPARNQQLLYPDRTIRSVKRRMGSTEPIRLGEQTFTPPEISALILRELARWAGRRLGAEVNRAVITVPAYFSDAQRQATREAGELAGLEVLRLVNEPTAASLSYGFGTRDEKTVMVYDLGGGTFDVSIVAVTDRVTEVLASHGNTRLGGDDFDGLLVERLAEAFADEHGIDLRGPEHRAAQVRLYAAAEEAKMRLSAEPFAVVREEALAQVDGEPRHLDLEISREEYERMIRPLVESTLDSVSRALDDAGKRPSDIDVVLLVGGSTRTPLVAEVLEQRMGQAPRQDVHPDLCVALGAGLLGSRLAGHDVDRVLVDVCPYSFGVSFLGERDGQLYSYCYKPIIRRNTPLPVTRTELFTTAHDHQTEVEIEIFQGEDPDALNNTKVGEFRVEGLTPVVGDNDVLCTMKLDLDGILQVTATEKCTSMSAKVTIAGATAARGDGDASRSRLARMFEARGAPEAEPGAEPAGPVEDAPSLALSAPEARPAQDLEPKPDLTPAVVDGRALLERCRGLMDGLHPDDRAEAIDLNEDLETAISGDEAGSVREAGAALREFLFFVEGR